MLSDSTSQEKSPSDITDIIITHPHPDHIGGVLLFPGARVWMQREDFLYFVSGKWKKEGSLAEFDENDVRNIIEISLQGRLELIEGDDIEIIPGIMVINSALIIPGHDNLVFSRFPEVCKGIVKIGN